MSTTIMNQLETTAGLWSIVEENTAFEGCTVNGFKNCMSLEYYSSDMDGVFETPAEWENMSNLLACDCTEVYFSEYLKQDIKKPFPIYDGSVMLDLTGKKAVLTFDNPITVVLGYVGETAHTVQVKQFEGELTHEFMSMRNGDEAIEIYFSIGKYLS